MRHSPRRLMLLSATLLWAVATAAQEPAPQEPIPPQPAPQAPVAPVEKSTYSILYDARIVPTERLAKVSINLSAVPEQVRWLRFVIDSERHFAFRGDGKVEVDGDSVLWEPPPNGGRLSYSFWIDHLRNSSSYDARCSENWALFRGDDMVPPARVRTLVGAESEARLRLRVPDGWSAALPYERLSDGTYAIADPRRRFDRPTGWMVVGKIGVLRERIAGARVAVAGPMGQHLRRHDILALLRWTLPTLRNIIGELPDRILVVGAGDPMWRGGLSGPKSVFIHADRPLISTDLSSPILHELMHSVMSARAGPDGDWVVEGLAELYSLELLVRSKTVSRRRHAKAMDRLERVGRGVSRLAAGEAEGPVTARAVVVLREIGEKIGEITEGASDLDDVLKRLCAERGVMTFERFRTTVEAVAGKDLSLFARSEFRPPRRSQRVSAPPSPPPAP